MRSIKSKIFLSIVVCSIFIAGLVGGVSIINATKTAEADSREKLTLTNQNKTNELNSAINSIQSSVNTLSEIALTNLDDVNKFTTDPQYVQAYQDRIEPIAKQFAENTDGAMTFYIRFNPQFTNPTSGLFYSKSDENSSFKKLVPTDFSKYDPTDLEHVGWYYTPVNAKKATWLDPYLNSNINVYMVSYVVPLYKDGKSIGVVGMDINYNKIQDILQNTKTYDSGYAFLVDSNYNVMTHPKLNMGDNLATVNNGELKSVTDFMDSNSEGGINYSYDGVNKSVSISHLSNGWVLGLTAPISDIQKQSSDLIRIICIIGLIGIIIACIIAFYIGNIISKPIIKITNIIKKTGNLDLTYDNNFDKLLKRKDEIGQLSSAFNNMRKEFVAFIQQTSEKSNQMKNESEQLKDVVTDLTIKAEDIEQVVNKITNNIQETSASSEEISASIQEVDSNINVLSSKALEGSNSAAKSKDRAIKVRENGKVSIEQTRRIYNEKKEKGLKAIEDAKIVDYIKVMADTISQIAEQTNLLALNAAIEAARAGEQGKGFAVVAEEVRGLAEQSSEAVASIQDTISKVQVAFNNLAETSKDVLNFIKESVDPQFESIREVGEDYFSDADFVTKMSDEIAAMSEELTATINEVSKAVQGTAEIAQKSSESSEVIKDSIDKTTKAIEKVAKVANAQAKESEELNKIINKFKI